MGIFSWIKRYIPQEKGFRQTGAGVITEMSGDQLDAMMSKSSTAAGAFALPGFKRGVDLISSKVSGCQASVFKRIKGNGRETATDHPAYQLVRRQANPYSHPRDVFKQIISDALWNGNGYAWVQKVGATPTAIWNLDPTYMTPVVIHEGTTQTLLYSYKTATQSEPTILDPSEVIHVKGLSLNCGLIGMRLIDYASQVLQLGLSVQSYCSQFFEAGGVADSWVEVPEGSMIDEDTAKQLQDLLRRNYSGSRRSRNPVILTGGAKLNKSYLSNTDGQMLDSRGVTLVDVANLLNFPVSKLNGTGSYNYGSLESENVAILGETYDPWIFAIENQLERCLLLESEREDFFIELDRDDLMRGDPTAAAAADIQLWSNGVISWKEMRTKRNLPTEVDDTEIFKTPANLVTWNPNDPREEPAPEPVSVPPVTPEQPPVDPQQDPETPPAEDTTEVE